MLAKPTPCFANEATIEAGQRIDPREQKVAVVAITDNPFAGRFGRDLKTLTQASFALPNEIAIIRALANRTRPEDHVGGLAAGARSRAPRPDMIEMGIAPRT